MPITVNCTCGKAFDVSDDTAGMTLTCQSCGRELLVGKQGVAPLAPLAPLASGPLAPAKSPVPGQSAKTMNCPTCAEQIPVRSVLCPMCGEALSNLEQLDAPEYAAALAQVRAGLAAHTADANAMDEDARMKGGTFATKTLVLMAIMGLSVVMIVMDSGKSGPLLVFGIMFAVIFIIPMIISLVNDSKASHIQDVMAPAQALTNFLSAVKTGRTRKAFVALVPPARQAGKVDTIKFKADIPSHTGSYSIDDSSTFKTFWKSIFTGPSGQSRIVTVRNVRTLRQEGDVAVVQADLEVTNYPMWAWITVFLGLLVVLIVILVIQKKETRKIRKVLIKQNGLWYLADGSLEGVLDRPTF